MLDREMLKNAVKDGIKLVPYEMVLMREVLNEYGENDGYYKLGDLTGVLYPSDSKSSISKVSYEDKGTIVASDEDNFLIDYNDVSKLIEVGDLLLYTDKCYKVTSSKDNFEIYFDIKLEKIKSISKVDKDTISVDGKLYSITGGYYD